MSVLWHSKVLFGEIFYSKNNSNFLIGILYTSWICYLIIPLLAVLHLGILLKRQGECFIYWPSILNRFPWASFIAKEDHMKGHDHRLQVSNTYYSIWKLLPCQCSHWLERLLLSQLGQLRFSKKLMGIRNVAGWINLESYCIRTQDLPPPCVVLCFSPS